MVLLVYGSNDYRLKIWEKVDGMVCHSIASIFMRDYYLQYTNFLSLNNKESTVDPDSTVHTLGKKEEIKTP